MDVFFFLTAVGSAMLLLILIAFWPNSTLVPYVRDCMIVFAAMFLLRCFLFEWFRIPSSSMEPTLIVGDFVIVDKNDYGLTLPFIDGKVTSGRPPRRGEIAVFRFPMDPEVFYIKRIIGLPGDHLVYREDRVFINGRRLGYAFGPGPEESGLASLLAIENAWEGVDGEGWHPVRLSRGQMLNAYYGVSDREPSCETREFAEYRTELSCKIPEGHFFVLGDNRHHSSDSRVWGFVPKENLTGPAFGIVFNWSGFGGFHEGDGGIIGGVRGMFDLDRIGARLRPEKSVPQGMVVEPPPAAP